MKPDAPVTTTRMPVQSRVVGTTEADTEITIRSDKGTPERTYR
jgi:hypothetical protein